MTDHAAAADYREGQIWRYDARPGEEASRLYIVKIDEVEGYGRIYHIFVEGLRIKNPRTPSGFQDQLPHAPVVEATLDRSVTELVGETNSMPDFVDGYAVWKEAFDKGEAGAFNIPVADIVSAIEDIANRTP